MHRQTSTISRTFIGNKIVYHSDVIGASPIGAAPPTYSFSTEHLASMDWAKTTTRRDEKHLRFGFGSAYIRCFTVCIMPYFLWDIVIQPIGQPMRVTWCFVGYIDTYLCNISSDVSLRLYLITSQHHKISRITRIDKKPQFYTAK